MNEWSSGGVVGAVVQRDVRVGLRHDLLCLSVQLLPFPGVGGASRLANKLVKAVVAPAAVIEVRSAVPEQVVPVGWLLDVGSPVTPGQVSLLPPGIGMRPGFPGVRLYFVERDVDSKGFTPPPLQVFGG